MAHYARRFILSFLFVSTLISPAFADVSRVTIASRTVVANGLWFGAAGPYEKIAGTVFFELDPGNPRNRVITDIDLAPKNARGRVEFSADLFILAPQDPTRASGSVLFEISNRGNKGLLTTFNRGTPAADPIRDEHFGDGLLMRNGFTLVWVGWEFDVPGLKVTPPIATLNGSPLVETIAAQVVVDAPTNEAVFSDVPLYQPFDMNDETATLTVRDTVWSARVTLPRRGWRFVLPAGAGTGRCAVMPCPRVSMAAGFEPGRIYELKYRASNPPISGGGIRLPDQAVPIGTLTGWNFRTPSSGNPNAIVPLLGSLIPFAKTAADRRGDPRKSLEERYRGKADYLGRVTEAGLTLVKQGYVLREDLPYLLERAAAGYDWATQRDTGAVR